MSRWTSRRHPEADYLFWLWRCGARCRWSASDGADPASASLYVHSWLGIAGAEERIAVLAHTQVRCTKEKRHDGPIDDVEASAFVSLGDYRDYTPRLEHPQD